MITRLMFLLVILTLPCSAAAQRPFFDRTHQSQVFGEPRTYRIFLPSDYDGSKQTYPVIYYFHGHSDRYTLERYDEGKDTVPKIAAFVAAHPVIVVAVDGYVARDYTGFYGGSPWDIREEGGEYDFGAYFRELVAHIDGAYRTLTSRRARAISGLSMGGFMSLYLSARYPDLIGSASSFRMPTVNSSPSMSCSISSSPSYFAASATACGKSASLKTRLTPTLEPSHAGFTITGSPSQRAAAVTSSVRDRRA